MNFPSLLSDHEQRAFSEFLNQLAQEDHASQGGVESGPSGIPPADPSLIQQQQQQLQLQLQHHLHLRQLQQQHQQHQQHQHQHQNGIHGLPRMAAPSVQSLPPLPLLSGQSIGIDGSSQLQRDFLQQIVADPVLAPGGIINPHTMSQAMLQNPLLMAQASAISQAMVLAQQQQLQLQMQQQQQQQQFQQQQHLSMQHGLPFQSQQQQHQQQHQQPGNMPSLLHGAPQQPSQSSEHEPLSPTMADGGAQGNQSKPTKRKSNQDSGPPAAVNDNNHSGRSSPSRSSSPFSSQPTMNGFHSPSDPSQGPTKQESDMENGSNPAVTSLPPMKKAAKRKGSTAKPASMDLSATLNPAGLVAKSSPRSNRDGFDPLQGSGRRRSKVEINSVKTNGHGPSSSTPDSREIREDSEEINTQGDEPDQQQQSDIRAKRENSVLSPSLPPPKSTAPSPTNQHHRSKSDSQSPAPGQGSAQAQSRAKKPQHELLTEAEKKANHIASEQKRRQNIRIGFDSLVEIVPTLGDCHRSEAVILQKSVDYIQRLLGQKSELKTRVRELQIHLGDPVDDLDSDTEMEVESNE